MPGSGLEFVDTNVLLYAYDATAGDRHARAVQLVDALARRRRAAASVQVLQEFFVNATRKIAEPLDHGTAIERVRVISRWTIHAPTARDVEAAAKLSGSHHLSFWDAMIVRSASMLGCATLWSEDLNAGHEIAGVTVLNPFVAS